MTLQSYFPSETEAKLDCIAFSISETIVLHYLFDLF